MSRQGTVSFSNENSLSFSLLADSKQYVAAAIASPDFPEDKWNEMFVESQIESVVYHIRDEIVNQTLEKLYKLYLQAQVIPFTVECLRQAWLKVLTWKHITKDQSDTESTWEEDPQPMPSVPDSYSSGAVQFLKTEYLDMVCSNNESDIMTYEKVSLLETVHQSAEASETRSLQSGGAAPADEIEMDSFSFLSTETFSSSSIAKGLRFYQKKLAEKKKKMALINDESDYQRNDVLLDISQASFFNTFVAGKVVPHTMMSKKPTPLARVNVRSKILPASVVAFPGRGKKVKGNFISIKNLRPSVQPDIAHIIETSPNKGDTT